MEKQNRRLSVCPNHSTTYIKDWDSDAREAAAEALVEIGNEVNPINWTLS